MVVRGLTLSAQRLAPAAAATHFDGLYRALASSPTHARIGREALGAAFHGQLGHAAESELLRLAELAGAAPGRRILEVCCGSGGVTSWLAERTGATVVGIDCSLVGLRLGGAAARGRQGPAFIGADAQQLPLARSSVDGVVCLDGFAPDFRALTLELLRVLRPGGTLALLVSLPAAVVEDALAVMHEAGAAGAFAEDLTGTAIPLLRGWLRAYGRHARAHVAEVGERHHRALVGELEGLLDGYERGALERRLLAARRR